MINTGVFSEKIILREYLRRKFIGDTFVKFLNIGFLLPVIETFSNLCPTQGGQRLEILREIQNGLNMGATAGIYVSDVGAVTE